MRLLLVTDTFAPDINGVARTLHTLARGLCQRGHAVQVATTVDAASEDSPPLPRHILSSMPLPGYPGLRIGFATTGQMLALIEAFGADVLYVATETPMGIAAIRAGNKLGVPVVSGFHTNFQSYLEGYHLPGLQAVARGLLRTIHNQTARTLTPSSGTALMLQSWGVNNVGIMGRGVDTDLFQPERRSRALRAGWGADDATPVAICVGRIAVEKNLALAVRAFAAFRMTHPGAPCVMVGDGPRLKWMQTAHPEILYTGARVGDDLAAHYASGDVFIFPSITETFGNVVLEAMAAGIIPVAFDYAAPRLLIQPGSNGWLAPFADQQAFLDQIRTAAAAWDSPAMKAGARKAALDLSWKHVIEQFEAELIGARPNPAHPSPPQSSLVYERRS